MKVWSYFLIVLSFVILISASCDDGKRPHASQKYSADELIDINRKNLRLESSRIDSIVKKNNWQMALSSTGIRFNIYHHGNGDSAVSGQLATIAYQLFLLSNMANQQNPTYQSKTFRIDQGNEISGLHEAVKMLKVGDSASFIIPSYLAYGLTGASNVPSNTPIYYDICLKDLR